MQVELKLVVQDNAQVFVRINIVNNCSIQIIWPIVILLVKLLARCDGGTEGVPLGPGDKVKEN